MARERRWYGHYVSNAVRDGLGFAVKCLRCDHQAVLPPETVERYVGPYLPVHRVHSKLRCTACDSRNVLVWFVFLDELQDYLRQKSLPLEG
ncbi:hypothetical protein [Rhodospirillaceae bacterium SYSU D60014]|uniref:hypothetical protein n=1 Tax=Virgifigura deserti TaxID=2268457 RepID=UPI000E6681D3